MQEVTTYHAKTHLSTLIAAVERGEEIVILRGRTPVARLVPFDSGDGAAARRPRVGVITSAPVTYTADAFAPLDEASLEAWGI